jgi:hypothetical protein
MRISRLLVSMGVWICLSPASSSHMLGHQRKLWYFTGARPNDLEAEKQLDTGPLTLLRNRRCPSYHPSKFRLLADANRHDTPESQRDPLLGGPVMVLFSLCREAVNSISSTLKGRPKGEKVVVEASKSKKKAKKSGKKKGDVELDQDTLNKMLWKACDDGRTSDAITLIRKVNFEPGQGLSTSVEYCKL